MNSEGANSFYLLVWKEQTLKGHSWVYFFLLYQVTRRLESLGSLPGFRHPAHFGPFHFSLESIASSIKWVEKLTLLLALRVSLLKVVSALKPMKHLTKVSYNYHHHYQFGILLTC